MKAYGSGVKVEDIEVGHQAEPRRLYTLVHGRSTATDVVAVTSR